MLRTSNLTRPPLIDNKLQKQDQPGKPGADDNCASHQMQAAILVGLGNNSVNHDENPPGAFEMAPMCYW